MQNVNSVTIAGNLTRDPELKETRNSSVLEFAVAVNESRRDGDEYVDYPNYIDCVVFGRRAESLANFLAKGAKVAIQGRLHQDRWETDEGKKRSKLVVYVDHVDLMQRRDSDSGSTASSSRKAKKRDDADDEFDGVPF